MARNIRTLADDDLGAVRNDSAVANDEPLAGGFAAPTRAQWETLVRGKDGDPALPLTSTLEDGLETGWLYGPDDALAPDPGGLPGAAPWVRGMRVGGAWAIRQRIAAATRVEANAQVLEELEGGATEVLLALSADGSGGIDGGVAIPVADADQLAEVLDGVLLDLAPVALDAGAHTALIAPMLLELWRRSHHPATALRGSLRLDPIGVCAQRADAEAARFEDEVAGAIAFAAEACAEFPSVQALAVDTTGYVEAGAGAVLELALAAATGIAYLRADGAARDSGGLGPVGLAAALEFTFVAGPDQFVEIAKLRAARRLWSTVLEHCGVAPTGCRSPTYVRTSRRMTSSLDPWVNMLRDTSAAFAAGVGGADGVTVVPFDEPHGLGVGDPGALGRRVARNTQLVLIEEGSLHRVADPAGGSWYVESLTDQLARRAWVELQELERAGGIVAALASGAVAARVAAQRERRQEELAHRRRSMTGVNMFPLLGDDGLQRTASVPAPAGASPPSPQAGGTSDTFAPIRDGAAFEALRDRAARLERPRIVLVDIGPAAAHVNADLWARGFFEAGGIEAVSQPEERIELGGARVAAVCAGSDADPVPAVAKLRGAGVETVYLVGATQAAASAAGADVGVRDGVDMVAVLGALLDRLERVPA